MKTIKRFFNQVKKYIHDKFLYGKTIHNLRFELSKYQNYNRKILDIDLEISNEELSKVDIEELFIQKVYKDIYNNMIEDVEYKKYIKYRMVRFYNDEWSTYTIRTSLVLPTLPEKLLNPSC